MNVQINNIKVEFNRTHHANHKIGATFIRPDGKKTYGEYTSIKDAMDHAKTMSTRKGLKDNATTTTS